MDKLWYFLTIALDVAPFIIIGYLPFRKSMILPYKQALAVCSGILFIYQLGMVWASGQPFFNHSFMATYRLCQLLLLLILTIVFVGHTGGKALFVLSLLFPYVHIIIAVSSFVRDLIPYEGLHPYMVTSILRLAITCGSLANLTGVWKRYFVTAVEMRDEGIFKLACIITLMFSFIAILGSANNYELNGITAIQLVNSIVVFCGALMSCIVVFYVIKHIEHKANAEDRVRRNELLLELQKQQYVILAGSMEETRKVRHDLRHHLAVVQGMLAKGEHERLKEYISGYISNLSPSAYINVCSNFAANAVFEYYIMKAKERGIDTTIAFQIDNGTIIKDSDLCIIIGNCMENAIEANENVPVQERFINVKTMKQGNYLYIIFDNSFDGTLRPQEAGYLSRKRDYSVLGTGVKSVRAVVERYNGYLKVDAKDNVFSMSMSLKYKD